MNHTHIQTIECIFLYIPQNKQLFQ